MNKKPLRVIDPHLLIICVLDGLPRYDTDPIDSAQVRVAKNVLMTKIKVAINFESELV